MTTALETAFPLNSNWPAATVRSKLAEAMIGVFDTPDLSGEDFSIQPYAAIAVAGPTGDLTFYAFDAGDTTTADDGGITCIVVSGRRYIRSGEVIVRDAAISATISVQPATPTFGDTYIVPQAPSGDDWSGQAKTVATYTARGWVFRQPFVGMIVYVEDEDGLHHYDSSGNWVSGLPIGAIADRSIPVTKLDDPFAIIKVEDIRNDPPGTAPALGTSYIVGVAPSDDFIGHVNDVARWAGSAWTFIQPTEGDTIYRRDSEQLYTWRSGQWVPSVDASPLKFFLRGGDTGTVNFPDQSTYELTAANGLTGNPGDFWLVEVVSADLAVSSSNAKVFNLRLYLDNESEHRESILSVSNSSSPTSTRFTFYYIEVPDASPHDIRFVIDRGVSSGSSTVRTARLDYNIKRLTPSE